MKKTFENKVMETVFWVLLSPLVSILYCVTSLVIGIVKAFKVFWEFANDYTKNITEIWTNS